MADHNSKHSPQERRRSRKQTILSQSPPEIVSISTDDNEYVEKSPETETDDNVFEEESANISTTHNVTSTECPHLGENILAESDAQASEMTDDENNEDIITNNDVSDIVYDDTKPKRLSHNRPQKLELENNTQNALHETISYLISPDDSPTRRKRRPLNSTRSEPVMSQSNSRCGIEDTKDTEFETKTRRATDHENRQMQTLRKPRYSNSPESNRKKVSSPVQRLMVKNSALAAAAAANSKDRKCSSEARLTNYDKQLVYIAPRRKISSDARLEHRYLEEHLSLPSKNVPKRKVSFDTSALINGNRMMPLNDEPVMKEKPHIIEEVSESIADTPETGHNIQRSPKLHIPKVILTTDDDEGFDQNDKDSPANEESCSENSEEGEEGYASGCDNKAYIKDEDEYVQPKETSNPASPRQANGTRERRLSPMSDPSYKFNEAAVLPHTNMDYLTIDRNTSANSPGSYAVRRISAYDDQSPPKSILKTRRDDAESINSEDSVGVKNFKVRKDSIALFMDQHGEIAMQELRKQHTHRFRCFGKGDVKQLWENRKLLVEKYKLHLLVLTLFLLTFSFVIVGLHFHSEHHKKMASSQKVFFDAKARILTLSDVQNRDTLTGTVGLGIPSWKMPTHCYPNYKKIMDKTCLKWKEHGQLDIAYFIKNNTQCYNITWNLLPGTSAYDCYEIGGRNWYGPLNMTRSQWPIRSKPFSFTASKSKHYGSGTFASAVEYYWLSSRGEAVVVDSNFPLEVSWNKKKHGSFCAISKRSGDFYSKTEAIKRTFSYSVCNGIDIQTTHALIRERFYPAVTSLPDRDFLENPHWSTVSDSDDFRLNGSVVKNVAESIKTNKLNCSTIEIDGKWEHRYGDLTFDKQLFNNMTDLVLGIADTGCGISLNVYPFFGFHSKNFIEGMNREYFVTNTGGTVPALLKWEHGVGAMLDVSNPAARDWYVGKIRRIASDYGIDTFRLVYGSSAWVPKNPVFHNDGISPAKVKLLFSDLMATLGNVVVESTSQSQHISTLVGIPSAVVTSGSQFCLKNIIPDILNLGLMGYPFVLSDGFSTDESKNNADFILPSRDLFIRWMQLSTFLPAIRYTVKPWSYDAKVVEASRNLTKLHSQVVLNTIFGAGSEILKGSPVIQPMWWNRSNDRKTFMIDDQFVLADKYLVAPILCECGMNEGVAERDVYVPKGVWRDATHDKVIIGPRWIKKYKAAQFEIPYFERMPEMDY
ncbi:uncharacterized protein LOC123529674 [Mercenaria mercenaria]|uniref:uncharacterized protein LOC123529674 n=1 Tax=Mercenaria mercenaria TaxID=6596 RepID=UPI00234E7D7E|nr:uncharacterized protein LOC123529674 [Mercenaria mercenaria]